jgi:hypothetical protein
MAYLPKLDVSTLEPTALIGCECSGVIRDNLRAMGIDAWSCDIKPCERKSPYHLQMDVMEAIQLRQQWGLIGLHPDCTAMAVSGNRWYGRQMPYHQKRLDAVCWTTGLWNTAKIYAHTAYLENPVSVIFSHIDEPVQYIQPWQFGHGETKRTGFALHNLPKLTPTDIVDGREQRIHKMPPGPNRKADRSRTYSGVGLAIAKQWGGRLLEMEDATSDYLSTRD